MLTQPEQLAALTTMQKVHITHVEIVSRTEVKKGPVDSKALQDCQKTKVVEFGGKRFCNVDLGAKKLSASM